MARATHHVPKGFHTVTPYLIVDDAAAALDFYQRAFAATELSRHTDDAGRVRHAEFRIGDSPLMITEECADYPAWLSPQSRGGTPVHLYLYLEDCDAVFGSALAAGATELLPLKDQFYGDRSGALTDPFGHVWYIATHKEELSPEEMAARAAAETNG
jgi:PhnB protein